MSIPPPTGIVDNDILLAFVFQGNSQTGESLLGNTPPSGFVQIGTDKIVRDSGTDPSFHAVCRVYWKRAASESGNYAFVLDTSNSAQGFILAIAGAKTSGSPVDVSSQDAGSVGSTATVSAATNSTTATAPSVTTSVTNTLLVYCAGAWGSRAGANSPPTGFTEQFDGTTTYGATKDQAAAGATGTVATQVNATSADPWFAFLTALLPQTQTFIACDDTAALVRLFYIEGMIGY